MNKLLHVLELSRRRARDGHLGVMRQLGEMVVLFALRGVGPGYYHTAGFWRRVCMEGQDPAAQRT